MQMKYKGLKLFFCSSRDYVFTYISFQNEKCHLLIEHETQKLKELDEEHTQEIKEWREKLRPRKKVHLV